MKWLTSDKRMLEYELMKAYPNISCFSTTRKGGFSEGNYSSFNCNGYCGDEPTNVLRNRELLCNLLPQRPIELVIPLQTHDTQVRVIDALYIDMYMQEYRDPMEIPESLKGVDALVTDIPGYCLCISTADCVPVMLYDARKQVIAAIHAGWRGTVGRIVEKVFAMMEEKYGSEGKDIVACIGPSISLDAFEVGEEVYEAFQTAGFDMHRIARKKEKWHIDLWEANRLQLLDCGLEEQNIEVSAICTYRNETDFFSARRLGIRSGRILSGIMLHRVL